MAASKAAAPKKWSECWWVTHSRLFGFSSGRASATTSFRAWQAELGVNGDQLVGQLHQVGVDRQAASGEVARRSSEAAYQYLTGQLRNVNDVAATSVRAIIACSIGNTLSVWDPTFGVDLDPGESASFSIQRHTTDRSCVGTSA